MVISWKCDYSKYCRPVKNNSVNTIPLNHFKKPFISTVSLIIPTIYTAKHSYVNEKEQRELKVAKMRKWIGGVEIKEYYGY